MTEWLKHDFNLPVDQLARYVNGIIIADKYDIEKYMTYNIKCANYVIPRVPGYKSFDPKDEFGQNVEHLKKLCRYIFQMNHVKIWKKLETVVKQWIRKEFVYFLQCRFFDDMLQFKLGQELLLYIVNVKYCWN